MSGYFHLAYYHFHDLLMDISYGSLVLGNISLRKGVATEAKIVILMKRCSISSEPISEWQISLTMLRSRPWYWARVISPPLRCPLM